MEFDDIERILELVRQHDLAEFELEREGLKIRVRKASAGKTRARSASSTCGASSLRQISRVSSMRSVASSVGMSRVAVMIR